MSLAERSDRLHTVPDARDRLGGISNATFYLLVKSGDIRLTKIGRRSFVADSEIERFIRERNGDAA